MSMKRPDEPQETGAMPGAQTKGEGPDRSSPFVFAGRDYPMAAMSNA